MLKLGFGLLGSVVFGLILTSGIFSSGAFAAGTTKVGDICIDYYGSTSTYKTNCVKSTDISDSAVTGAKIAAGAVTGSKLATGTVTGSNIAAGTITPSNIQPVANRVVVAVSGGDYTSIWSALASINPTAATPYVIDVMPGTYTENITMKSYVDLRGAGQDVTTIQSVSPSYDVIVAPAGTTNVAVTGFTIKGGTNGIISCQSPMTITHNTFTGMTQNAVCVIGPSLVLGNIFNANGTGVNIGSVTTGPFPSVVGNVITNNSYFGLLITGGSPLISGNTVTGNGTGIFNQTSSSATITGNIVSANSYDGIGVSTSSTTISGNTISNNGMRGVDIYTSSSPTVTNNKITGNGSGTYSDIEFTSDCTPNISFNVYNTITGGGRGLGQFNVNSTGGLAPTP
jgi:parallel beta-helix repeat protein